MEGILRISKISQAGSSLSGDSQNSFYQNPKFRNGNDAFEYMFLAAMNRIDADASSDEDFETFSGEDEIDSVIRNTVKRI